MTKIQEEIINHVMSLYVMKTCLLFSCNFLDLENINFQTFLVNYHY